MTWYLFHKDYQGGSHEEWLMLDHKPEQCDMENWGERTSGGHAYGYTVHVKKGIPPKEIIEAKIERAKNHLKGFDECKEKERKDSEERLVELRKWLKVAPKKKIRRKKKSEVR